MNQPTVATRMYAVERDSARHELELLDHDKRLNTVERRVDVMAARIAIYASLGAFIGGGAVAVATTLLN